MRFATLVCLRRCEAALDRIMTRNPPGRFPQCVSGHGTGVRLCMPKPRAPMRAPLAVVLLVSLCGCANSSTPLTPQAQAYQVLFIGNSLTYTNDLPATVGQLASSAGDSIEVESVALPNLALIDHVNGQSDAVEVIRGQRWDYVVLQQGPSSLPVSRDTLILATKLLDPDIRASGGRTAELMVWPARENFAGFDQVRVSYQDAALAVNGLFLPGGEAWRTAWAADPSLQLYSGDGYHPSQLGSLLAALVVYEGITGRDAQTLPAVGFADGHRLDLSAGTIRLLQRAAHETVSRFRH
jgi:hypothetical protein